MKFKGTLIAALLASGSATAQDAPHCVADTILTETPDEGGMRLVMMMHGPLEHRKVCGLATHLDRAFFDAMRVALECEHSQPYADFFEPILVGADSRLFAADVAALTPAALADYCQVVGRIDLSTALDAEGGLITEGLAPVYAASRAANDAAQAALQASTSGASQ